MQAHVKLYGVLKTAAKTEELELDFENPISIRQLVSELISVIASPEFETYLIDADTKDVRDRCHIPTKLPSRSYLGRMTHKRHFYKKHGSTLLEMRPCLASERDLLGLKSAAAE